MRQKKSIAARYKDPDAVLFKDLRLDWQQQHICGQLNAKNGYGAYTGYERFRAALQGTGAATVVTDVRTQSELIEQMVGIEYIGFDIICEDREFLKGTTKMAIEIPIQG